MKRIPLMLLVLLGGAGVGTGSAWAMLQLRPPAPAAATDAAPAPGEEGMALVPSGRILAPLVFPDGRLAGYAAFQVQLQVPEDKVDQVAEAMPLLLNAINMRTFRTPLAAGPDGLIADLERFRTVVRQAADESFGKATVARVLVTQAGPA